MLYCVVVFYFIMYFIFHRKVILYTVLHFCRDAFLYVIICCYLISFVTVKIMIV